MKHRTAIVTAASVMLVVVAATAAIAANLGILASGTDTGEVGTLTVAASTAADVPASPITKIDDVPNDTTTSSTNPAVQEEAAPTGEITAYSIGDAGVVTLENDGFTLTVVDITPNPGWQTAQIPGAAAVEVGFVGSDGTVLMFAAQLDATGTIQTVVQDLTAAPDAGDTGRSGDDDDDDGHESGDDDD